MRNLVVPNCRNGGGGGGSELFFAWSGAHKIVSIGAVLEEASAASCWILSIGFFQGEQFLGDDLSAISPRSIVGCCCCCRWLRCGRFAFCRVFWPWWVPSLGGRTAPCTANWQTCLSGWFQRIPNEPMGSWLSMWLWTQRLAFGCACSFLPRYFTHARSSLSTLNWWIGSYERKWGAIESRRAILRLGVWGAELECLVVLVCSQGMGGDSSELNPKADEMMPVIVYYHGGGFVFMKPNVTLYDQFCRRLAGKCSAVVVSVHYRQAIGSVLRILSTGAMIPI